MELQLAGDNTLKLVDHYTGEEIPWNVSIFERTRLSTIDNLFRDINGYWTRVPENRLRQIWNIYAEIREVFNTIFDFNQLTLTLMELVSKLYELMPIDEIENWVKFYGKVKYPDVLEIEHDPLDPNPGRTYLRSDYHGLIVLTVSLRPMVPIWGEYMSRIRTDTSSTFKEFMAMKLLTKTYVINNPYTERLKIYIQSSIKIPNKSAIEDNSSAILAGLGTDELPDWLLAFVAVRRMSVVEIDASKERGSIISNIYGYVSHAIKDLDRKFGGAIKEKRPEGNSNKKEDEISQLESYRVKHEVSYGEISLFSIYGRDVHGVAKAIDPTIPDDLVDYCQQHISNLLDLPITRQHITLVQWITATVIPSRAIYTLHKADLLRLMGVTQAILKHWGFHELAIVATAEPHQGSANVSILMEVKHRLSPEIVSELNKLYPYTDPTDKDSSKKANYGIKAITTFHKEVNMIQWRVKAGREIWNGCQYIYDQGSFHLMAFSPNALETIAKLVIHLNTRNRKTA